MNEAILDKLISARMDLVIDEPFFGVLALRLKPIENEFIPTMGTDGTRLVYNPAFVEKLSNDELKGVFCHEVLHCSNGHPWREDGREHTLWNIACDFAINPLVLECKMKLPSTALIDKKFEGMSAEQIYALIPVSWIKKGCGFGEVMPSPGGEDVTEGEKIASAGDWKVATLQAAKAAQMAGKLPAALSTLIEQIANPKLDWRAQLQNLLQQALIRDDYTWKRPNERYFAGGFILPSLWSERIPPIRIYVDASGSCWEKSILEAFAAEINGINSQCKPEAVFVDYFDTRVNEGTEHGPGEPIILEPKGGGGTDFRPIFEHVIESGTDPAAVVILTDGWGAFPETNPLDVPVIWAMNTSEVAPWGTTLDIR